MHARASAKFAAIVDSFKSKVEVTKGNLVVPGNSIMGLLTLAAEQGSIISIQITGEDEKEHVRQKKQRRIRKQTHAHLIFGRS